MINEQLWALQDGVGRHIFASPSFWLQIIFIYTVTFGIRFLERSIIWLYKPNDSMILSEMEAMALRGGDEELKKEQLIELGHSQVPLRIHGPVTS